MLNQPQYLNNVVVPQQQFVVDPTAVVTGDQQQQQGPGILSRVKEGITRCGPCP